MLTAPHIHAMVIHFPIALIIVGFLSEVVAAFSQNPFYKKAAFYLLILGTLGTIVAFVSGSYAGDGMTDGFLQEPIEEHEDAALITLWLAIITALFRSVILFINNQQTWIKWTSIILYAALVGFVGRTGYLGGELVFKHGAGIELVLPDFEEEPTE